jgi:hypothetical protein
MQRLIRDFQASGHDIVLMMDANEPCGPGTGVDRLISTCGLADAHASSTATTPAPATHQRGSQTIDFILISPRLVTAISAVTILALNDGYASDHRALDVDFNSSRLLGSGTSLIVALSPRRLTSTDPRAVHVYVESLRAHFKQHRLVDKAQRLQQRSDAGAWGPADIVEWESIDRLLSEGRLASEKQCPAKRSGQLPWSPTLVKAGLTMLFWNLKLRSYAWRTFNSEYLGKLAASADIPMAERQCTNVLKVRHPAFRRSKLLPP